MTPDESAVIESWGRDVKEQVHIGVASTPDPRSDQIGKFCSALHTLVPMVKIDRADPADDTTPFIRIHKQIHYKGVPRGRELAVFLNALAVRESEAVQKDSPDADLLEKIQIPCVLKIYVSALCPFCPQAVSALCMLARRSEKIHVRIIDGEMFADLARQDDVRSVPTVILDDGFRWTGSIAISEIIDMMIRRDPAQIGVQSLRSIIEAGDAEFVAQMMAKDNKVYPAFIELLVHPKWPVRLGAMAAFEYLDEISPDLAEHARLKSWERFEPADDSVKGDISYLSGGSRRPEIRSFLMSVIRGDYADEVREAAREALETVKIAGGV
jgi:glutaredoxin